MKNLPSISDQIEERQHKSTALIKRENINIQKTIQIIENSSNLKKPNLNNH